MIHQFPFVKRHLEANASPKPINLCSIKIWKIHSLTLVLITLLNPTHPTTLALLPLKKKADDQDSNVNYLRAGFQLKRLSFLFVENVLAHKIILITLIISEVCLVNLLLTISDSPNNYLITYPTLCNRVDNKLDWVHLYNSLTLMFL